MTNNVIAIIENLEKEKDIDDLYQLLTVLGKKSILTAAEKQDLKNILEGFLSHENAQIRAAAIRTLGFYWGLKEYTQKSMDMFLYDSDEGTKDNALMTWSSLFRKSNNKEVMDYLYVLLTDENQPMSIRNHAYVGMLVVSPLEPKDWPNINIDWDNFNHQIDWSFLARLLQSAKDEKQTTQLSG